MDIEVVDRRGVSLGFANALTRSLNNVTHIVVHHDAVTDGRGTSVHEVWWRNPQSGMGTGSSNVGGYHEHLRLIGDRNVVELNYNESQQSWGVAGQNAHTYHICMGGLFRTGGNQPTARLRGMLIRRISRVMDRRNIPLRNVVGHNELASTACPGINMADLRRDIERFRAQNAQQTTPPTVQANPPLAQVHIVRQGETLSGIARERGTTVDDLVRLNNIRNANTITVGQRLTLPAIQQTQPAPPRTVTHTVQSRETLSQIAGLYGVSQARIIADNNIRNANLINVGQRLTINNPQRMPQPTQTPPPTTQPTQAILRVGGTVRVRQTASRWACGTHMPSWVRGNTYTVQEIATGGQRVLLAGVVSWANRADLEVVR